jgi:class 3 adenylate cyclase/tetratricopeptide (TPR) repeat protein
MTSIEPPGQADIKDWAPASEGIRHTRAIIAADLVGYSELVFRDPHLGVRILRETRSIVTESIRGRGGSIVDTAGDFVLATFPDVAGAVAAATVTQLQLLRRHSSVRASEPGHWKIGIAHGEVFSVDGDYYGTAINVAARLQALAGPGEICMTSMVRERTDLPPDFEVHDIGSKHLKNIDTPVRIFRAVLPAYDTLLATNRAGYRTSPKLLRQLRKPVLRLEPFRVLGKSAKTTLLAEALIEEVHLILSRITNSISVTGTRQKPAASHDYVLSGTMQSGGPHLRIVARLASCSDGLTVWAERFECDLRRPFDVQEQIAREIVAALQLALTEGEQAQLWRRGTQSGEAWEHFQRGHDFERRYTRQGHQKAIDHYRKSLEIDPTYLSAMVSLAFCMLDEIRLGWASDPARSITDADELCQGALNLQARHADVQALLAFIRYFQDRSGEALAAMDNAVALASHSPEIIGYQGALYDLLGDYRAAIRAYTRAFSLTVHSPAWIASNLGLTYLALADDDEAERIFRQVTQYYPDYVRAWIGLAIALHRQGKAAEAAQAAETVLSLDPRFTAEEWAKSRPFSDPALLDRFVSDLRETGLR